MSKALSLLDLESMAHEAAGNWRKFDSFGWYEQPVDAGNWCIVYTSNRDSTLLDQSNAAAIDKRLQEYLEADEPDIRSESHGHWLVGHVDGYAIRVYRADGSITDAFREWCNIKAEMDNYPVLDDDDYSQREYDAALENIQDGLYQVDGIDKESLPDGWPAQVYGWLWDNDQGAVESRDDTGAYPDGDQLKAALMALGYMHEESTDGDEESEPEAPKCDHEVSNGVCSKCGQAAMVLEA